MPKVIIWRDGAIETEFDPGHRDWRMGRSETNDITLLDPRKSVSRFHAELREENGRWVFIDLNSQNGSWSDGQRVNRLVLEHGNEVLFGDYRLVFEDLQVVAPPTPPPIPTIAATSAADVAGITADVPIAPDQTLLMPGKVQEPVAVGPPSAPAPVVRPAGRPKAPRKGINPLIIVLFVIAMLGVAAALAWKVLSEQTVEPQVVESPQPEPEPPPPPPVVETPVEPPVEPPVEGPTDPTAATADATQPPTQPPATTSATSAAKASPRARRTPPPPTPTESPALAARYEEGRRALAAGRFAEAERAFRAVIDQQPGFRDASARLDEARQGQAAARQKALADAQALEANGDWARAVAAYERAGATDAAAAARTKMTAAGDDAYRKARQFDARARAIDAITWYQRAVDWLPDSDARKATAAERLTALKGGGE